MSVRKVSAMTVVKTRDSVQLAEGAAMNLISAKINIPEPEVYSA
jgi:hypothetical protein